MLGLASLGVDTLDKVAVGEFPFALTLRFVVIELSMEAGAVRVTPVSLNQLAVGPLSYVFHASLEENIGALAVFLAFFPLSGVNILIGVGHDTLTLAQSVRPVTVIHTNASIDHFANAMLLVVLPATNVFVIRCNTLLIWLGEILVGALLTLANLNNVSG